MRAIWKIASDLGAISATYESGADLTTIVAIPEPAGLALLGLVGAASMFLRSRQKG